MQVTNPPPGVLRRSVPCKAGLEDDISPRCANLNLDAAARTASALRVSAVAPTANVCNTPGCVSGAGDSVTQRRAAPRVHQTDSRHCRFLTGRANPVKVNAQWPGPHSEQSPRFVAARILLRRLVSRVRFWGRWPRSTTEQFPRARRVVLLDGATTECSWPETLARNRKSCG